MDPHEDPARFKDRKKKKGFNNNTVIPSLGSQVNWLTPTTSDAEVSDKKSANLFTTENGTPRHRNKAGTSSNVGLNAQVNWGTARANNSGGNGKNRGDNKSRIEDQVHNFATPNTRDHKGESGFEHQRSLTKDIRGKLNPDWVECLMGWPVGWSQLPDEWRDRPGDPKENHVDRLRMIGNGVVPATAAKAFVTLLRKFCG